MYARTRVTLRQCYCRVKRAESARRMDTPTGPQMRRVPPHPQQILRARTRTRKVVRVFPMKPIATGLSARILCTAFGIGVDAYLNNRVANRSISILNAPALV